MTSSEATGTYGSAFCSIPLASLVSGDVQHELLQHLVCPRAFVCFSWKYRVLRRVVDGGVTRLTCVSRYLANNEQQRKFAAVQIVLRDLKIQLKKDSILKRIHEDALDEYNRTTRREGDDVIFTVVMSIGVPSPGTV